MSKESLGYNAQKAYVATMMQIVGRGLAATSRVDAAVQAELAAFPAGYQICMTVHPSGPSFFLRMQDGGVASLVSAPVGKPDLTIRFKHLSHAFLVFSFQEGTAQAFANDRMIYWSYAEPRDGGNGAAVARGRLSGGAKSVASARPAVWVRCRPAPTSKKASAAPSWP